MHDVFVLGSGIDVSDNHTIFIIHNYTRKNEFLRLISLNIKLQT